MAGLRVWRLLGTRARLFGSTASRSNVINELESRGMIQDLTSRAVRKHVEASTTVYLGVDPSAKSLHVGNLLALIGLLHFRLHSHNAILLIGGATGSVGDPSGRSTERNALSPAQLQQNIADITVQVNRFLDRGVAFARSRTVQRYGDAVEEKAQGGVRVENNLDWLGGMGLLDFLSTVGKNARVSAMLARESVKSRLDSKSGLSFTEFSYQLLQAYDFLTLHRRNSCTIQLGGSDQLGNILSGIEMIRKDKITGAQAVLERVEVMLEGVEEEKEEPAYGVTMPLLTTASGEKFGKSAGNAIWLDAAMTSPFALYQFFLRTTDEDVLRYLKIFSFIRVVELEGIMIEHDADKTQRFAQKILAAEATELVHGQTGLKQALSATSFFFNSDLVTIDAEVLIRELDAAREEGLASELVRLRREDVLGKPLAELVRLSGLVNTKTQARATIESGNLSLNRVKIKARSHQRLLAEDDLLSGGLLCIRLGKLRNIAVLII